MACLAIFASGNGSNFQALAEALKTSRHSLAFLLCNKRDAYALERARLLGVKSYLVEYQGKSRQEAEAEILKLCQEQAVQLIALAGFMKLLSPFFLKNFAGPILNLHPSLLPKYPGVDAIRRSYEAGEEELGISIIKVDEGCDTGPILFQASFQRPPHASLEEIEALIHALEHRHYPQVVLAQLDELDKKLNDQFER